MATTEEIELMKAETHRIWTRGYVKGLLHALQMFEAVNQAAQDVPDLTGAAQSVREMYLKAASAVRTLMSAAEPTDSTAADAAAD